MNIAITIPKIHSVMSKEEKQHVIKHTTCIIPELLNVIQEYDVVGYVQHLLRHWTPASVVWPDPSKNPMVTRYLIEHHAVDVLIPYLEALFQNIIWKVFGTKD